MNRIYKVLTLKNRLVKWPKRSKFQLSTAWLVLMVKVKPAGQRPQTRSKSLTGYEKERTKILFCMMNKCMHQ